MEFLRHKDSDVSLMLENMPAEERDNLPYGIIKLDTNGVILEFNTTESAITGRIPKDVIGKNFFTEVAPCTQTPEFFGKFQEGLEKQFLNTVFDYLFDYQMTPARVKVHMVYVSSGGVGHVWIIVKRIFG